MPKNKSAEVKEKKNKDIPLGGDYALDANDNAVKAFEDRTPRKEKKGK